MCPLGGFQSRKRSGRLPVPASRLPDRAAAEWHTCMTWQPRPHFVRLLALLAMLAGLPACEYLGGRTVLVEFESAEGITKSQAVYFAGVRVGKTGTPVIVTGRARVPVHLLRRNRDALPTDAVFATSDDPNEPGRRALVGYAVSVLPARVEDGVPVYHGVSCELELAVLVGAAKARELFEEIGR